MNVILIICLLAAYYVKHFRLYHLPESSISLMVGVIVGGIVRIVYATTPDHLQLWEFVRIYFLFLRCRTLPHTPTLIDSNETALT